MKLPKSFTAFFLLKFYFAYLCSPLENIAQHIEALIFASEQSITQKDISLVLQEIFQVSIPLTDLQKHLNTIVRKYSDDAFPFSVVEINGGYQFLTKSAYHLSVHKLQIQRSKKKLSQAALETLSIIAYKQPVTKLDVEQIRGVNCDYTIQKLLEKDLIAISGKSKAIGKPLLYSTSATFMDYFGINSAAELPQIKDLPSETEII
ncbi:segregation and condensation protein B [Arcticibacter pallidicorallinus]|uniref:Segregation and condensation protein B n=1 Tax=Arcticibacter pallidicorallinus TaxID=1259464 RepID=A0A2T0U5D6_9SPHI|nr:segregation and condensation protein B [Arcticibacter pallidicorallinus]